MEKEKRPSPAPADEPDRQGPGDAQAGAEEQAPVDERGRRLFDENGQPIHWATGRERVVALILALVVIAITIAFAYSLSTGDLIRR